MRVSVAAGKRRRGRSNQVSIVLYSILLLLARLLLLLLTLNIDLLARFGLLPCRLLGQVFWVDWVNALL
jgi:hypothetical protein